MNILNLNKNMYPILIMELCQGHYGALKNIIDNHTNGYGEICEAYEDKFREQFCRHINCVIAVEITVTNSINICKL